MPLDNVREAIERLAADISCEEERTKRYLGEFAEDLIQNEFRAGGESGIA